MKKIDQLILIVGISLVIYSIYNNNKNTIKPLPAPSPSVVVPNVNPVPTPPDVPAVIDLVLYDKYDKALELSKKYNKSLILIFGASWCPYCQDLKKDSKNIRYLNEYIVCFLDTEKQESLINKYKIKGLPTSVVLKDGKEVARKSGYKRQDYESWLNGNLK